MQQFENEVLVVGLVAEEIVQFFVVQLLAEDVFDNGDDLGFLVFEVWIWDLGVGFDEGTVDLDLG